MIPVVGSVAMLEDGKLFAAVFINRAFTWSGVRLDSAAGRSASGI
jgi:hypothetical protein